MLEQKLLQENHTICLQLLDKFLDVCQKHNITYYLAFGSCLGTVRHQGFIPWDINVDILLTWPEFQKLDQAMHHEDLGNLSWDLPKPGARMFPLLRNPQLWEHATRPNVDVSIYVPAPKNKYLRALITKAAYFNIKMFKLKNTPVKRSFPFNILKGISSCLPNKLYLGVVHLLTRLPVSENTDYYMVLLPSVWENREYIKKEWFGSTPTYGQFEGRQVRLLANSDAYLTMRYGDYKTPKEWKNKGSYTHAK